VASVFAFTEAPLSEFATKASCPKLIPGVIVLTSFAFIFTKLPLKFIKNKDAGSPSWKSFVSIFIRAT